MVEEESPRRLRGRIIYFLGVLVVLHFSYPLSELSTLASAIYLTGYTLGVGFGAYITSQTTSRTLLTGSMTLLTLLTGLMWVFTSNDAVTNGSLFIFYTVIIINNLLIVLTLFQYVFSAERIGRDILAGGVAIYMLIGNIFTPIYLLLNAIIVTATNGEQVGFGIHTFDPVNGITWQRMYYLSFTILTTLGFGDITPVHPIVEPFVLAQAIIGVLYLTIFMARLVSLYDIHKQSLSS